MKVYLCKSEGAERFVEASGFGEAIRLYLAAMNREFPNEGWNEPDTEPESVQLVSDEPVIR